MLMEEVDAKVITREMAARQAAEEATTWVVPDGHYEATVLKWEELPEEKRWESEVNSGVRVFIVDFQAYDVPGKASKVQGIRIYNGPIKYKSGEDKTYGRVTTSLITLAGANEGYTKVSEQLAVALDWAKTNRVKIEVGNTKPKDEEKLTAFLDSGRKVYNRVYAIKKA